MMPGMTGLELAIHFRKANPGVRCCCFPDRLRRQTCWERLAKEAMTSTCSQSLCIPPICSQNFGVEEYAYHQPAILVPGLRHLIEPTFRKKPLADFNLVIAIVAGKHLLATWRQMRNTQYMLEVRPIVPACLSACCSRLRRCSWDQRGRVAGSSFGHCRGLPVRCGKVARRGCCRSR
jgi:hypothetical protein